jgi:3-hydroxybutyrate dehydrogenase
MNKSGNISFNFNGKSILVTGASSGIGYAITRQFCDAGAQIFILAEGEDIFQAADTLSEMSKYPVKAYRCDITDSSAVASALNEIEHLDVLVNNAGLERITPVLEDDSQIIETFRRIIDTNVMGTYHVTRHAVNKMPSGSCVIMTCSIWSRTAVAEFSAYCSSKHANLGFLRSMAQELAPRGIRVNGVCPGWVKTQASMLSLENMALRKGCEEQSLLDEIVGAQLLDGLMNPEDVAATYLFLASDAAVNITGQTITVDRGEQMS